MRPLMSISQSTEYIAQRVDGNGEVRTGHEVTLRVGLLGIMVTDPADDLQVSYSFFTLVRIDEHPSRVTLTVLQR